MWWILIILRPEVKKKTYNKYIPNSKKEKENRILDLDWLDIPIAYHLVVCSAVCP
jgi:hypothetical protein